MSSKTAGRIGKYDKAPTKPVSSKYIVPHVANRTHTVLLHELKYELCIMLSLGLDVGTYRSRRFSAKAAKRKWDSLEKAVS